MAEGDILAVSIEATGDRARIKIEGKATGGTYDLGLGTNNAVSGGGAAPKLVFTATSLGYDATGAATTIQRTVYGTFRTRKVTPDDAEADETVVGSDVEVVVWLSDYIYQKDQSGVGNSGTDVSVVILSGFYTETGASNAFSGTVTNNSTVAYPKVVANWSWPGYELIPSSGLAARCVAFHRHAMNGKPVACVIFEDSEGANTESATVTAPTVDETMEDAVPVVEYVGTPGVTSLTQGAVVTRNFRAYPWVGDSGSILDTSAGTAAPTPLYGPQKLLCDKTGGYQKTYAKVNPATGSDSGANTVYDSSVYNPATAYKFASISKAAATIASYNNTNYGRNDVGAAVIELEEGNYAWLGNTGTYGTTPNVWITIRKETAASRSNTIIASTSGNGDISDRIKLENVTITTATANTFTNIAAIWCHKCDFNSTGTGLFNTTGGVYWVTQGLIRQLTQGLRPVGTANCTCALVRGNNLTGFTRTIQVYTVVGNLKTTKYAPSSSLFIVEVNGQTGPQAVNFILAYNEIYGYQCNTSPIFECGRYIGSNTHGGAVVQNLFENCDVAAGGLADVASSDSITTNTPIENLIIWHNTWVGQRCFIGYNDATSTTKYRRYWSQKNNYFDRWANKGDTFTPADANRIGAWPVTNNVGSSGNIWAQTMISLPGNFYAEFAGIHSFQPDTSSYSANEYADFVDRQSTLGVFPNSSTAGTGDGDYTTNEDSPLRDIGVDLVLPYDLAGSARTASNNDAGAYAHAVPAAAGGASDEGGRHRKRRRRFGYGYDWWWWGEEATL